MGNVKGSERAIGKGLGDNPASCCLALLSWKRSSDKAAHYGNDLVPASHQAGGEEKLSFILQDKEGRV